MRTDHLYDGNAPLSQLVAGLSDANFDARFDAIRLLVRHQANINAADEHGVPPMLAVLKMRQLAAPARRRLVELLLADPLAVDQDTHWEGKARQLLQRQFPDLQLPAAVPEAVCVWTDALLLDALRSRNEERFVRGCDARAAAADADGWTAFVNAADAPTNPLRLAIENGLPRAVEKLLRCGAAIPLTAATGFDALRLACVFGDPRIVAMLLAGASSPALADSASAALVDIVPHIGSHPTSAGVDHRRCFDQLLTVLRLDLWPSCTGSGPLPALCCALAPAWAPATGSAPLPLPTSMPACWPHTWTNA